VKKFLIGFAAGLIVVPVAIYVYFAFGMAPVATAAPEMPFERLLAKKALRVRREREMPRSVPIAADESNYAAGAHIYREHCAVCHGLPKQPQTAVAKGMYPKPPALLDGKGVTDDPAGETYWKVAGGIRMSGMPGFQQMLSSTEMWQVSILLAHADRLPQKVQDTLAQIGRDTNVAAH
jgi:thiosulfate dehydrogenase